jgi:uncharacterized protein YuzE
VAEVEEHLTVPTQSDHATWHYDQEADVLYISASGPRPALGFDIGDGLVVRYDEDTGEVVGLTIIGLLDRFRQEWAASISPAEAEPPAHAAQER